MRRIFSDESSRIRWEVSDLKMSQSRFFRIDLGIADLRKVEIERWGPHQTLQLTGEQEMCGPEMAQLATNRDLNGHASKD